MLEVRNLYKRYGRTVALENVTLPVPPGELTAVVGPNASGKTTLMKAILGLVRVDRGEILWQGSPLHTRPAYQNLFGYMPQNARYPENLTPREVLAIVAEVRKLPAKAFTPFVEAFTFQQFLDRQLWTLSAGTRQKLSAILALGVDAPMLMLDEPTVGFDPVSAAIFRRLFLARKKNGTSVLLVSHLLQEVQAVADRVAFLEEGRIVFSGSVAEIQAQTRTTSLEEAVLSFFAC